MGRPGTLVSAVAVALMVGCGGESRWRPAVEEPEAADVLVVAPDGRSVVLDADGTVREVPAEVASVDGRPVRLSRLGLASASVLPCDGGIPVVMARTVYVLSWTYERRQVRGARIHRRSERREIARVEVWQEGTCLVVRDSVSGSCDRACDGLEAAVRRALTAAAGARDLRLRSDVLDRAIPALLGL